MYEPAKGAIPVAFHERRHYMSDFRFSSHIANEHFTFLAHWHTEVELVYVAEGAFTVGINQNVYTLRQGDVAVCGSGDIHYYNGGGSPNTKAHFIIFDPNLIGHPSWPADMTFSSPLLEAWRFEDCRHQLRQAVMRAHAEFVERKPGWELLAAGEIHKLCGMLIRNAGTEPVDAGSRTNRVRRNPLMQDVIRHIERHAHEDLSLERLAAHFNLSPFYFSRIFNQTVGMNFRHYLNRLRVRQAEGMIASSDLSLLTIALNCGFGSLRTFNRIFKQIKGMPPSALRANAKK